MVKFIQKYKILESVGWWNQLYISFFYCWEFPLQANLKMKKIENEEHKRFVDAVQQCLDKSSELLKKTLVWAAPMISKSLNSFFTPKLQLYQFSHLRYKLATLNKRIGPQTDIQLKTNCYIEYIVKNLNN